MERFLRMFLVMPPQPGATQKDDVRWFAHVVVLAVLVSVVGWYGSLLATAILATPYLVVGLVAPLIHYANDRLARRSTLRLRMYLRGRHVDFDSPYARARGARLTLALLLMLACWSRLPNGTASSLSSSLFSLLTR